MIKHREYFGIIPLICGILLIISLLMPFMYFTNTYTKYWLLGVRYDVIQDIYYFASGFDSLFKGLVVFISFIVCAISLIRTFFMTLRTKWKADKIKKIWFYTGLTMLIISVINYMFSMMQSQAAYIIMEFGFYGPIFTAIIAFIGLFFYRKA